MKPRISLWGLALYLLMGIGHAAGQQEDQGQASDAGTMTAEQFEATLNYQRGLIELPGGLATLEVPDSFRYLGPEDADRILVEAWGNPPGDKTLGMLFPAAISPLSQDGWGIVITYSDDGHVSDEDADAIDYNELLANMQTDIAQANEERQRQGYPAVNLVGWAEAPHYDKASHKLYWAKQIRFSDSEQDTLNFNIRVLGREGVLVLNAVAGMNQLTMVKENLPTVLAFTNFKEGQRYADFNASTDKVAAYGLAALVGGAVAAKMGLFAKLLAILVAAKKFVIIALVALGAFFASWFKKKRAKDNAVPG